MAIYWCMGRGTTSFRFVIAECGPPPYPRAGTMEGKLQIERRKAKALSAQRDPRSTSLRASLRSPGAPGSVGMTLLRQGYGGQAARGGRESTGGSAKSDLRCAPTSRQWHPRNSPSPSPLPCLRQASVEGEGTRPPRQAAKCRRRNRRAGGGERPPRRAAKCRRRNRRAGGGKARARTAERRAPAKAGG